MKVTDQMIDAAMRKATEAGLLPRHARQEDMLINQELMRVVLQSALDAAPAVLMANHVRPADAAYDPFARKRTFSPLSMAQLLVSIPL